MALKDDGQAGQVAVVAGLEPGVEAAAGDGLGRRGATSASGLERPAGWPTCRRRALARW